MSIHGVEKTDETGRLCRLNLAVHGLEGEIKHGGNINSYYDDPHDATGRFDFVLANPPFNVNAVDTAVRVSARPHPEGTPQDLPERQDHERLKDMVGPGRRFPFGLPRTDNANYLWVQLFHTALNEKGRAGFVMARTAGKKRHWPMKMSADVLKFAAKQCVSEEEALQRRMEEKSCEFAEKRNEVYAKVRGCYAPTDIETSAHRKTL